MANGLLLKPESFSLVTSSTTAMGYRASNVGVDNMGNVWRSETGSATQSLVIDLGADTALDTITLHGLTGAQATWQWTVELATEAQGKFTGSYWSDSAADLLAGATMPVNGRGRGIWQAPGGAPSSARYVRLAFSVLANAAIEVGRVCIGSKIQLGQNFSYPAVFGVRSTGSSSFSSRGVFLPRVGVNLRGIGLACEGATRAEVEGLIMPLLEEVGNEKPIVLVLDPDADAQRQNRIYFGPMQGDLGATWRRFDNFVWQVNVVALD